MGGAEGGFFLEGSLANGLNTVVEAAKILNDEGVNNIDFLLVGDGPEKDNLIKMSKELKLNNITFMPEVKKDMVPAILNKSDICITIVKKSKVHQYGISMNKNFDYLASGKPIIFAIEAYNDLVKQSNSGISVSPEEPGKLAKAIIRLANMSSNERKQLGRNGRKYVEQYHDYEILTDKLVKVMEELI